MTRQSIQPTYDHRETGDRFTVESRVDDRRISFDTTVDPFVNATVHVGWKDLLRGLLRGNLDVTVIVSGDREIVEDVCELNADYLGLRDSTRNRAFRADLQKAMERL